MTIIITTLISSSTLDHRRRGGNFHFARHIRSYTWNFRNPVGAIPLFPGAVWAGHIPVAGCAGAVFTGGELCKNCSGNKKRYDGQKTGKKIFHCKFPFIWLKKCRG